jgi:hypothetical protein
MANTTTTTVREPHDYAPDMLAVKSRVSWGAVVAGAVIAMACYLVLMLLFGAIGVSLTETNVRDKAIGYGVIAAMVLSLVGSLFLGGWVASQLTAGENQREAAIYGLLTWAVFMAIAMWMVATGVRAGYFAAVGGAVTVQNNERIPTFEEAARQAGYTPAEIAAFPKLDPARVREAANDPGVRERAREGAITAAWTALVATMLSMAAALGGALVGCGATFRLFNVATVRREPGSRLIVPAT